MGGIDLTIVWIVLKNVFLIDINSLIYWLGAIQFSMVSKAGIFIRFQFGISEWFMYWVTDLCDTIKVRTRRCPGQSRRHQLAVSGLFFYCLSS